jgi:hypothetical protein
MRDAESVVQLDRGFSAELRRSGAARAARQGRPDRKSSGEASELLRGEFRQKYPDWGQPLRIVAAVNAIYAELP